MNHPETNTENTENTGNTETETERLRSANAQAGRLREALAEAAYDITPSRLPLAAIEHDGRARRRRRRAAVFGASCGLLVVPLAVVGLRSAASGTEGADGAEGVRVESPAVGSSASPAAAGKVRVVTPGERVRVAPGTKLWLTEDGMHWTEPDAPTQFTSIADGNIALREPGVTLRATGRDRDWFLFGIYHGTGGNEAARVKIETVGGGESEGSALTLAGSPKWGAWYATVKLPESPTSKKPNNLRADTGTRRVTVYDAAGGVIATADFGL